MTNATYGFGFKRVKFAWLLLGIVVASGAAFGQEPAPPSLEAAETTLRRLAEEGRGERTAKRISDAIAALGEHEFKVREQAMRDLRVIGHRAIPGLRHAAGGEDLEIRKRAEQLLDWFDNQPARLPLELRPAIRVLRDRPAAILPLLGELLHHPNPTVQHVVIHELRRQSGTQFGFSIHHKEAKRKVALQRWSDWLAANEGSKDALSATSTPASPALLVNTYDQGHLQAVAFDELPVASTNDVQHSFPEPIWSHPFPGRTAFALVAAKADGTQQLLVSHLADKQLRAYDRDFAERWNWSVPRDAQPGKIAAPVSQGSVYGIHPLPDGELLLGIGYSWKNAVIKLSAERKIIDSMPPPPWQPSCVVTMPLPQGDDQLVVPFERANRLVAFDGYGSVKWNRDFTSPRRVRQLPSGHLLLATRNAVLELSPAGETLWRHECHDPVDALRLPDGRTAILLAFDGLKLVDIDHKVTSGPHLDIRYGSLSLIPPGPFAQKRP